METESICTLLHITLQEIFLSKTNSLVTRNKAANASACSIHGFLWGGACVRSTELKRNIWRQPSLSRPWNTKGAGSISCQNSQDLTRKQCVRCSSFLHRRFSSRDTSFSSTDLIRAFGTKGAFPSLKIAIQRKFSFRKLMQFSQENNVVEAPGCNTDGLILKDTCLFSIKLNMPIWNKMSLSPPRKFWFAGSNPFKNEHNSHS